LAQISEEQKPRFPIPEATHAIQVSQCKPSSMHSLILFLGGEKYVNTPYSMSEGNVRKGSVIFEAHGVDNIAVKGINLASSCLRRESIHAFSKTD
jgi:hypothetical protein